MALSPRVDEVLISTIGTDNCIRIAKLENKRINKINNKTQASKLKYPIKNSSFFSLDEINVSEIELNSF